MSTDLQFENGNCYVNETYVCADLENSDSIFEILEGADLIVHFGAIANEAPFKKFLGANFIWSYNIWETARLKKIPRII